MGLTYQKDLDILIVDDDPTSRHRSSKLLRQFGVRAYEVSSGEDAIKACGNRFFDMILMDLHMPEKDGYETVSWIRNKGVKGRLSKVVALSGVIESKEVIDRCLKAGMVDCIAKPITKNVLRRRLIRWFPAKLGQNTM